MTRLIDATDLELYAINAGEFYKIHCAMAYQNQSLPMWEEWLRFRVLPHYKHEIGPVTYDHETVANVARSLRDYYVQHLKECQ